MEWWKTLAPLVGVVLGSLGTLLGQKLSDRRTLRRDRLLAEESARIKLQTERVALQRETIMEIQHGLEAVMMASRVGPRQQVSDAVRAVVAQSGLRLNAHIARLEDRELAASVQKWMDLDDVEAARSALDELQGRLSDNLRALYTEALEPSGQQHRGGGLLGRFRGRR